MQARSVYPISISLYPLYCTPPASPPSSLQVMARWTKEFISLLVRHLGRSSLSLKEILWLLMTVCRGWLVSSKMARSFFVVLFSATVITTIQLEADHRAGPPDEHVKPGGVHLGCAASPTHQFKKGCWRPPTNKTLTEVYYRY